MRSRLGSVAVVGSCSLVIRTCSRARSRTGGCVLPVDRSFSAPHEPASNTGPNASVGLVGNNRGAHSHTSTGELRELRTFDHGHRAERFALGASPYERAAPCASDAALRDVSAGRSLPAHVDPDLVQGL
jgi:hypothetical protein